MHVSFDFLHLQEAVHGFCFHPHYAVLQSIVQVHVVNSRQASGRGCNNESLGTKQLPSINHPMPLGWGKFRCCKMTAPESGCGSARCENGTCLIVGSLSVDMSVTNMVDCIRQCRNQVLNRLSCRKLILPPYGFVVSYNTTLTSSLLVE